MELLTVHDLSLERAGRLLVADLDLTLRPGMRLALIGANGSGKSSLLEVLAGRSAASEGSVRRSPGIDVGYLPQRPAGDERASAWDVARAGLAHLDGLERELRAQEELLSRGEGDMEYYGELRESFERSGGYAAEAVLRENLASLGVTAQKLSLTFGLLSGGEQKRLALAGVLAAEPPLLLLDEPSNDLDLPAIRWLGDRLRRWRGALLLVSHDRELLNRVSTHTALLQDGRIEVSRGSYTTLREQQGVARRSSERRERERRKEVERLEGIARELRSWGNAGAQRQRRRAERELERLATTDVGSRDRSADPLPLEAREAEGKLLEVRHLGSSQGDRRVIVDASLSIYAGDRIALLGPNGSGKSTLLRLLAGEQAADDPRVEFWWNSDLKILLAGQHDRGLAEDRAVLAQLEELVSAERARMLLALSGLPRESWERLPGSLSGGERARAGLARLLAAQANLLLLDEPTNDLDLSAIETLQGTLETSDAAFVLVTHDLALARLATRVWSVDEGRLVEYRGGVEGYLAGRRRLEPGLSRQIDDDAQEEDEHSSQVGDSSDPDGCSSELADQLERLELERSGLEARLEDPLRLADRERHRLEGRLRETFELLAQAYDARLPQPRPAFSVREGDLEVTADLDEEGLSFEVAAPVRMRLVLQDGVGHLILREEEGNQLLPWARGALLDGAVRLAFYALAPAAVQHHSRLPLDSRLLEGDEDCWWTLDLDRFEELEGWRRESGRKREVGRGRRSVTGAPRGLRRGAKRRSRRQPSTDRETL